LLLPAAVPIIVAKPLSGSVIQPGQADEHHVALPRSYSQVSARRRMASGRRRKV
jgi:hypothetical protein